MKTKKRYVLKNKYKNLLIKFNNYILYFALTFLLVIVNFIFYFLYLDFMFILEFLFIIIIMLLILNNNLEK